MTSPPIVEYGTKAAEVAVDGLGSISKETSRGKRLVSLSMTFGFSVSSGSVVGRM